MKQNISRVSRQKEEIKATINHRNEGQNKNRRWSVRRDNYTRFACSPLTWSDDGVRGSCSYEKISEIRIYVVGISNLESKSECKKRINFIQPEANRWLFELDSRSTGHHLLVSLLHDSTVDSAFYFAIKLATTDSPESEAPQNKSDLDSELALVLAFSMENLVIGIYIGINFN